MRRSTSAALALVTGLLSNLPARAGAPDAKTGDSLATARFRALVAEEWANELVESPLLATFVGVHDRDDLLPSLAEADLARSELAARDFLARLRAIDRSGLAPTDAVSHELLERSLAERIESRKFGEEQLLLNADSGFHTEIAQLPDSVPVGTVAELERYLARLAAVPRYFDEAEALLARGAAAGRTPPRVALRGVDGTAAAHVVDAVEKSVFWEPFANLPATIGPADAERLRARAREVISGAVVPAYRKLATFLRDDYLPRCRTSLGASEMPDGAAYYRYLVRHFTTLPLEPEAVHETGLEQVARIRAEMEKAKQRAGFAGDLPAFLAHLRTAPEYYAKTPRELLERAAYLAKKIDGKLPALFGKLPRLPYGVAPVPDAIAPKYTSGRYVPAPVGGTQPGWYWVNTYALDKRPLYNLPALTLHEAVPGHHLQGSLAQELQGLPEFRRFLYVDAFGEGWGLYSEWLGLEAGMYEDPVDDFGRLGYEAWRACRLVVDTGIHAFGWSREKAIDYLAANTTLPLHECETEVDRYISWPGQALSYYVGFMKFRELRARAERELGAAFDVRAFHDAVLANGTLSMPALERQVDGWIARTKATVPPATVASESRP